MHTLLGWQILKRLGTALIHAAIFGGLLGAMVYWRLPRDVVDRNGDEELSWHEGLRWRLEELELPFYDWRARALGAQSEPSDDVVWVSVDDETLSNVRAAESPVFGVQPWPRELVGALMGRMVQEGSALVLLESAMPDASPVGCRNNASAVERLEPVDDVGLRRQLDQIPQRCVLGFGFSQERGPTPVTGLYPYLLSVGKAKSKEDASGDVRRVLAQRRPAFVIAEGGGVQTWAGVGSSEDGAKLAAALGLKSAPVVREFASHERAFQVDAEDLLTGFGEVQVSGLDASRLLRARSLEPPFAVLLGRNTGYGALDMRSDLDGRVRSIPLLVAYEVREGQLHVLPSAPLAAALAFAGSTALRYEKGMLHIGERFVVPMEPDGRMWIRWDSPDAEGEAKGSVKRAIPAWRIIVNYLDMLADRPAHYDNDLERRVVVFSPAPPNGKASRLTPIGGQVSQGAIIAQSVINLLRSQGLRRVEPIRDLLATFVLAWVGAMLALGLSALLKSFSGAVLYLLGAASVAGAYLWYVRVLFIREGLWMVAAAPLLAMGAAFLATTFYLFRTQARVREFVYGTLGRYVSPELARRVHRDLSLMKPERRRVTVASFDIEGFTYRTRDLSPEQLAAFLGEYFTAVGNVIRRKGGLMDRHGSDQIIAFWGAPLPNPRQAEEGCAAALEVQATVARHSAEWKRRYGMDVRLRSAVETGEAMVGVIQSILESGYSIVGDIVSRTTALAKANGTYQTQVLVSEVTASEAGAAFVVREADRMVLRDSKAVAVFELVDSSGAISPARKAMMAAFETALREYRARHFDQAKALFLQCAQEHGDPLSRLYAERSEHYSQRPPPPEWDEAFVRSSEIPTRPST